MAWGRPPPWGAGAPEDRAVRPRFPRYSGSQGQPKISEQMQVIPGLVIERMREEDIAHVQALEREIFLTPWPKNAYHRELAQNRQASYIVLRREGEIVGYGGLWKV